MVLFTLWLGCITNSQPTSSKKTLKKLSPAELVGCISPYEWLEKKTEQFCWDPEKKYRQGPAHYPFSKGLVKVQFIAGAIAKIQTVDSKNKPNETLFTEFLHTEAPNNFIQNYLRYAPDYIKASELRVKLYKDNVIPFSDLLSTSLPSEPCTATEEICIKGKPLVKDVSENSQLKTLITQIPTTYIDRNTATALEVQDCLDACKCSQFQTASTKLTWREAYHYCAVNHKRLPTEAELIALSQHQDGILNDFEWTGDWYAPLPHKLNIEPSTPCEEQQTCDSSTQKTLISKSHNRSGADRSERHHFRCVTSNNISSNSKPTPLLSKPDLPPYLEEPGPNSWHAQDPLYRDMLSNSTLYDPLAYHDIHLLNHHLWKVHKENTNISAIYQIATSHQGHPILAFRISNTPTSDTHKPAVLFWGGIHGNELMGTLQVVDQIDEILNGNDAQMQALPHLFDLWFIPLLNPDGNIAMMRKDAGSKMGRKNGRSTAGDCSHHPDEGVDLQLNFPVQWKASESTSHYYTGETPFSEPESQAIKQLAQRYHFLAALSFHTPGNYAYTPYSNITFKKPSPDIMGQLGERILQSADKWPMKFRAASETADTGTPEDWLFQTFGTYAYQIRMSKHNLKGKQYKKKYVEKYRNIWKQLLRALETQPSINGIVLNGQQQPITARIRILKRIDKRNKFIYYEREQWVSRAHDGYFQQLVPEKGLYEIEITAEGYRKTRKRIQIDGPRTQSNIVLRKGQ